MKMNIYSRYRTCEASSQWSMDTWNFKPYCPGYISI